MCIINYLTAGIEIRGTSATTAVITDRHKRKPNPPPRLRGSKGEARGFNPCGAIRIKPHTPAVITWWADRAGDLERMAFLGFVCPAVGIRLCGDPYREWFFIRFRLKKYSRNECDLFS